MKLKADHKCIRIIIRITRIIIKQLKNFKQEHKLNILFNFRYSETNTTFHLYEETLELISSFQEEEFLLLFSFTNSFYA
jgi:hypothetical protein